MPESRSVDVQSFLNEHPFSGYQWTIFALCFCVVLLDGFDTAAIGYIAPSLLTEWGVERPALAPVLREPSRDLAPQPPRHERRGLLVVEVEEVGAVPARDLEHVAEPLRRDQRCLHALPLGERVDHDRRPVREDGDVPCRDARFCKHVEDASLEVGRRRIGLAGDDLLVAGRGVREEVDEVGERSADVRRRPDRAGRDHAFGRAPPPPCLS
jgi:hypothetical protein